MERLYTIDTVTTQYELYPSEAQVIPFWKTYQPYGYMCQWYKMNFTDGINVYNCAEQYMMYQKALLFNDNEIAALILKETDPSQMQKYGRLIKNFNSKVWDDNKFDIVFKGNYLKFSQNNSLKQQLLNTGNRILAEASSYDQIWGVGMTADNKRINDPRQWYKGVQNLLGFILMEVRFSLRNKK